MVRERLGVETPYTANSGVSADSHCPGWGSARNGRPHREQILPHLGHEAQGWDKSIVSSPYEAEPAAGPDRGGGKAEESSSDWVGAVGNAGLEDDTPSTLRDEPML